MLEEYLKFSLENRKELIITSNNNKVMTIIVNHFDIEKAYFTFTNTNTDGQIMIKNIKKCSCKNEDDEKNFKYDLISKQYNTENFEETLKDFENYYMEILEILKNKEEPNSKEYKYCEFKQEIYQSIFKDLYKQTNNLLINYFTGHIIDNQSKMLETMLLLQQSNLSQKDAIKAALNDPISVIEGPPGTGKTTTIINIIANLVYQNKKVVIVSKNNSAIDNVVEELDKMNLPEFYIRFGNSDVMKKLIKEIPDKVFKQNQQLEEIQEVDINKEVINLKKLINKINSLEEELNELIKEKNELNELQNNLRHLLKKNEAYNIDDYKKSLKFVKRGLNNIDKIKSSFEYLAGILVKISDNKKIYLWDKILAQVKLNNSIDSLKENGILLHLILEEKYLRLRIEQLENKLNNVNLDNMKNQINELYKEDYIKMSKKIILQSIKRYKNTELTRKIILNANLNIKEEDKIKKCKNDLINLYPVILTTVDSVLSNFQTYFSNANKIDYVIIDEASQCDILSALPLLYIAKQIIVVGDCKQLSAIINILPEEIKNKVHPNYNYIEENFLSTILKSMKIDPTLLMEHYRCDYNIINFCNKYFYDEKLIIYTDPNKDAISLIDSDKGKYVQREGTSFYNEREIKTINKEIDNNTDKKFIITPFKAQSEKLVEQYNKNQCGTIHTFQGRGEDAVFFSTVLNKTDESIFHLQGKNNLFTKELINVAVSRAKKKFVLVTDTKFFKQYEPNIKNLIEYINVYGKVIPDKTVCIFDYLYNKIPTYQKNNKCDNIFEERIRGLIINYIDKHPEYNLQMKLPLAELIIDKNFLDNHLDIKAFILNNSHIDFTIYKKGIKKPVLAIELDGKDHDKLEQKERDDKKDFALKHMEIQLWRIRSKNALTEEEFYNKLEENLKKHNE